MKKIILFILLLTPLFLFSQNRLNPTTRIKKGTDTLQVLLTDSVEYELRFYDFKEQVRKVQVNVNVSGIRDTLDILLDSISIHRIAIDENTQAIRDTAAQIRADEKYIGDNDTHIAGGNLGMNNNYLSNDGDDEGISIDDNGNVGIGTNTPNALLEVSDYSIIDGITISAPSANTTIVGNAAGLLNATGGQHNTYIGYQTGQNITIHDFNTFIGSYAGQYSGASGNTYVGYQTGQNGTGNHNVFIGRQAGQNNTTHQSNVTVGYLAGQNLSGSYNTYIGRAAGQLTLGGTSNVYAGYLSGQLADGDSNSFLGKEAGKNVIGDDNTVLGFQSGLNLSGNSNMAIAREAGENAVGNSNTLLGFRAGQFLEGNNNVAMGIEAGARSDNGNANTFIGDRAGYFNYGGSNTVIGLDAAYYSSGIRNNNIGVEAGFYNRGDYNTNIGYRSNYAFQYDEYSPISTDVANDRVEVLHGQPINDIFYAQFVGDEPGGIGNNARRLVQAVTADSLKLLEIDITSIGGAYVIRIPLAFDNSTAIGKNSRNTRSNQVYIAGSELLFGGKTGLGMTYNDEIPESTLHIRGDIKIEDVPDDNTATQFLVWSETDSTIQHRILDPEGLIYDDTEIRDSLAAHRIEIDGNTQAIIDTAQQIRNDFPTGFSGLYTDLDFTGTTGLSDGIDNVDDLDNDPTNELYNDQAIYDSLAIHHIDIADNQQAIIDTALQIRSDFPIDTDTDNQTIAASFNGSIATLDLEDGNIDTLNLSSLKYDDTRLLDSINVHRIAIDENSQAIVDTASQIRADFPTVFSGNYTDLDFTGTTGLSDGIDNVDDADNDPTNELYDDAALYDSLVVHRQLLADTAAAIRNDFPMDTDDQNLYRSRSGTIETISIDDGNSIDIDVADNDNDPTNELYDDTEIRDSIATHRVDIDLNAQAIRDTALQIRNDFPVDTDNQTISTDFDGAIATVEILDGNIDTMNLSSLKYDDTPIYDSLVVHRQVIADTAAQIRADIPDSVHFANTNLQAFQNRTHNWRDFDFRMDSVGTFQIFGTGFGSVTRMNIPMSDGNGGYTEMYMHERLARLASTDPFGSGTQKVSFGDGEIELQNVASGYNSSATIRLMQNQNEGDSIGFQFLTHDLIFSSSSTDITGKYWKGYDQGFGKWDYIDYNHLINKPTIEANTDNQTLSLSGADILSISNGNTVNLSRYNSDSNIANEDLEFNDQRLADIGTHSWTLLSGVSEKAFFNNGSIKLQHDNAANYNTGLELQRNVSNRLYHRSLSNNDEIELAQQQGLGMFRYLTGGSSANSASFNVRSNGLGLFLSPTKDLHYIKTGVTPVVGQVLGVTSVNGNDATIGLIAQSGGSGSGDPNDELITNFSESGGNISITEAGVTRTVLGDDIDDQQLSLSSNILSLDNSASVNLSALANDPNDELITNFSESGGNISITEAGTTRTIQGDDIDNQHLSYILADNILKLDNGGQVDLSHLAGDGSAQTLTFTNPNLSISGGNTVDLSALSGGGGGDNIANADLTATGNRIFDLNNYNFTIERSNNDRLIISDTESVLSKNGGGYLQLQNSSSLLSHSNSTFISLNNGEVIYNRVGTYFGTDLSPNKFEIELENDSYLSYKQNGNERFYVGSSNSFLHGGGSQIDLDALGIILDAGNGNFQYRKTGLAPAINQVLAVTSVSGNTATFGLVNQSGGGSGGDPTDELITNFFASGGNLSITEANQTRTVLGDAFDDQQLSFNSSTNILSLDNSIDVDLSALDGGGSGGDPTDELITNFSVSNGDISITEAGVTRTIIDNTFDNQTLDFNTSNNELTITDGNTVDLSSLAGGSGGDPNQTISADKIGETVTITISGNNDTANFSVADNDNSNVNEAQVLFNQGTEIHLGAANGTGGGIVRLLGGTGIDLSSSGNAITIGGSGLASKWTQSGNNIYNNNTGNIGFFNTSPAYRFDIDADIGTAGVFGRMSSTAGSSTVNLHYLNVGNNQFEMALSQIGVNGAGGLSLGNSATYGDFAAIGAKGRALYVTEHGTIQMPSLPNDPPTINVEGGLYYSPNQNKLWYSNGVNYLEIANNGTSSDARLKKNIRTYNGGLEKLKKLPIFQYEYNGKNGTREGEKRIGLMAQDLQKVEPELVTEDASGYLQVEDRQLVYLLMNAVQELTQKVEDQLQEIETLKTKIND